MRGAGAAALATMALLSSPVPAGARSGGLPTYKTAQDAKAVKGTPSTEDAPRIIPGRYSDSIALGEEKHYAVDLDATSNAYVAAVAAPPPGAEVEDYTDNLLVQIRDSRGNSCGPQGRTAFRGHRMAYPVADYAGRQIRGRRADCQEAGVYDVVLKREGRSAAGPDRWPVELSFLTEPGLTGNAPGKPADATRPTETPPPPTAATKKKATGGTGFNDAGSVGKGVWKDRIRPGETRFYRVPVDWGQQLNVSAELPGAPAGGTGTGFLPDALGLSVYNPARGLVGTVDFAAYDGKPAAARMFTAPVDYGNRESSVDAVGAMRFAGWYYLEISLHGDTAKYFKDGAGLTLRVDVKGKAKAGPGYSKDTPDFSVSQDDKEAAGKGLRGGQEDGPGAGAGGTRRLLGYAGLGVGTVLLAGLGTWTLVARRRGAVAAPGASQVVAPGQERSGPGVDTQKMSPPQNP
ncbi:hypothetical protein [Streptomyces sp. MST-110588]|uniref:hypothetical protein n=1 Tax=Streptomyces sp. MST-110588 TaxID=2833628 RepID=UPI001F5DA7B8|nr:hypothetical protein [Streptomyces sp. MST-110588]UNO40972.1 hypothetical protein KGS77_17015 [Streptomyces sp. MST-110588]